MTWLFESCPSAHASGNQGLSTNLATLRAQFRREMLRIGARWIEGGPGEAVRQGALIAYRDEREWIVTNETIDELTQIIDGLGPDPVYAALELSQ